MKTLKATVTILSMLMLCTSCGYHRQDTRVQLPSWIRTIYIAPWQNKSTELRLGTWITDELREEFIRDSGLRLVSRDQADVILEGCVENVFTTGLSYITYDVTIERRVSVDCSIRLMDAKTGEQIWKSTDIYREESFYVGKDIMTTEGRKDKALKKLSRDVAEIVHHRIAGVF